MFKFNKKYLSKKTKGGAVAFGLSMATLALFGVVLFDGCVPGNANTTTVSKAPHQEVYAVRELKGGNQFDNNVASHRPFNYLARKVASTRPTIYGSKSHYGYRGKIVKAGHNTYLLEAGKKYHMSNKQYQNNQKQYKVFYNHVTHGENDEGNPINK